MICTRTCPGIRAFVRGLHHTVRVRFAVLLATDLESVQVRIRPVHAGLDDVVQLGQVAVRNLHATSDRQLDVPQRDLQRIPYLLTWPSRNPCVVCKTSEKFDHTTLLIDSGIKSVDVCEQLRFIVLMR
jgi:hypothetical protein